MMIVYARISTDGQIQPLKDAGCEKLFAGTASGTRANRRELRRCIASLKAGDAAEARKPALLAVPSRRRSMRRSRAASGWMLLPMA